MYISVTAYNNLTKQIDDLNITMARYRLMNTLHSSILSRLVSSHNQVIEYINIQGAIEMEEFLEDVEPINEHIN